jgi:D-cysteine desulfhydrase
MPSIPLTARFPDVAAVPRVELCDAPTPLQDAAGLLGEIATGPTGPASLWIKRDDLTSSLYGGNKVRKLEFLLGQARAENRAAVITFGAYGSNHALATAVHATALGLEPHAVLSPQAPGPFAARTLRAHAGVGTHLHLVEDWDGEARAAALALELAGRDGIEPALIPMGGTSPLGALGYVNAALEVLGQVPAGAASDGDGRPVPVAPDVVYVAAGTLGTLIGLAVGFAVAGAPTRVVGVRVTPGEVASYAFAEQLAADTIALLAGLDGTVPSLSPGDLNFELSHDWFEPGYGVVTPETVAAVATAGAGGIKLETTYTGKAFAALTADARAGKLAGQRVLFWDTYNSAPMPPEGPDDALPVEIQAYVAECDREFGRA